MSRSLIAILVLWLALNRAAAGTILWAEDFSRGISNGWQNVAFFKALTDYQVHREGTHCYLEAVANKSCSALTRKLDLAPPAKLTLSWSWRIEGVATNGSERELSKFDHAARVFLAFDTLLGPPRTLNYLWANAEPVGTLLPHPKSSRAQLLILESGNAKAGRWIGEKVDVTADWKRGFPGKPMPRLVGVGLMTDGDSLGQKLTGEYADLQLTGD
jgi:hypothetical protein